MRSNFDQEFHKLMDNWIKGYNQDASSRSIVDTIQWTFKCCGSRDNERLHQSNVTASCCDQSLSLRNIQCAVAQYEVNCAEAIKKVLDDSWLTIVLVIVETITIQWVSLLASWNVTKEYRLRRLVTHRSRTAVRP
ncbi:hypothetical protein HDE_11106 [Halotydeus destructor]|nr:hypothetical protein HDE_11106 [Halotydeus destructor]